LSHINFFGIDNLSKFYYYIGTDKLPETPPKSTKDVEFGNSFDDHVYEEPNPFQARVANQAGILPIILFTFAFFYLI
jgi:hypothetical protein